MNYAGFKLTITLGDSAMSEPGDVADALERVRGHIHRGRTSGSVMDVNGNTVGEWAFKTEHEGNDE